MVQQTLLRVCGECPPCLVPGGGCHRLRQAAHFPREWVLGCGTLGRANHSGSRKTWVATYGGSQLGGSCNLWSWDRSGPQPSASGTCACFSVSGASDHSRPAPPLAFARARFFALRESGVRVLQERSFASLAVPGFFLACLCSITLATSEHFHGCRPWSLP